MQQDNASNWADIKALEERLTNEPESFCFARLTEAYLAVGLVDDALHTARQGVMHHPAYLSGLRALALACHAKGMNEECRSTLQHITEALPEDIPSQKMLGNLCIEAGDLDSARQVFKIAREFAPDDPEFAADPGLRLKLSEALTPKAAADDFDEEEILDELEIYEELEIVEDDELTDDEYPATGIPLPPTPSTALQDPLFTATMAELYVTQGFIDKAVEIYRLILADDPADTRVAARLAELETQETGDFAPSQAAGAVAVPLLADLVQTPLQGEAFLPSSASSAESIAVTEPSTGIADQALATFEGWLNNIGRIRACR